MSHGQRQTAARTKRTIERQRPGWWLDDSQRRAKWGRWSHLAAPQSDEQCPGVVEDVHEAERATEAPRGPVCSCPSVATLGYGRRQQTLIRIAEDPDCPVHLQDVVRGER